jgi:Ran GTPase-activating protein (RanGAP) involved in mRNA processing and transport
MYKLTELERHHSKSQFSASLCMKIFLAQFLNTALVLMLVNARFPNNVNFPMGETLGVMAGPYDDFSRAWYSAVGVQISMTMMINVVMPHLPPLMLMVADSTARTAALRKGNVHTQEQMNTLFEGPEYILEQRYPIFLNTLFVTMFYCGGIPILLPFATVMVFVSYFVDKYMLMRVYRKPMLDHSLAVMTSNILPVAITLHFCMSMWMYGNKDLFESETMMLSYLFKGELTCAECRINDAAEAAKQAKWAEIYGLEQEAVPFEDQLLNTFFAIFNTVDPFGEYGFVPRAEQAHVFPIAALAVVAVTLLFLQATMGRALRVLVGQVLAIITCGQFGNNVGRVLPERIPISAYAETFAQVHVDKRKPLTKKQLEMGWAYEKGTPMEKDRFLRLKRKANAKQKEEELEKSMTVAERVKHRREKQKEEHLKQLRKLRGEESSEDSGSDPEGEQESQSSESEYETESEDEDAMKERADREERQMRLKLHQEGKRRTQKCKCLRRFLRCITRCCSRDIDPEKVWTLYQEWPDSGEHSLGRVKGNHRAGHRLLTWQAIAEGGKLASYDIMANPEYYKAMAFRPSHRKGVEFQVVKWQPLYSRAQVRAQARAVDTLPIRVEAVVAFAQLVYLTSTIPIKWPDSFATLASVMSNFYFDVGTLGTAGGWVTVDSIPTRCGLLVAISCIPLILLYTLLRVWIIKDYHHPIQGEGDSGTKERLLRVGEHLDFLYKFVKMQVDRDAEGALFMPKLFAGLAWFLVILAAVGCVVGFLPFIFFTDVFSPADDPQVFIGAFFCAFSVAFIVLSIVVGLSMDPKYAFPRYKQYTDYAELMKAGDSYQAGGGGRLKLQHAPASTSELERWSIIYSQKWFALKDKYSGLRFSLFSLATFLFGYGIFVVVPLVMFAVIGLVDSSKLTFVLTLLCIYLALWVVRQLFIHFGANYFNNNEAYAPTSHIVQHVVMHKSQAAIFLLGILALPISASLIKGFLYVHPFEWLHEAELWESGEAQSGGVIIGLLAGALSATTRKPNPILKQLYQEYADSDIHCFYQAFPPMPVAEPYWRTYQIETPAPTSMPTGAPTAEAVCFNDKELCSVCGITGNETQWIGHSNFEGWYTTDGMQYNDEGVRQARKACCSDYYAPERPFENAGWAGEGSCGLCLEAVGGCYADQALTVSNSSGGNSSGSNSRGSGDSISSVFSSNSTNSTNSTNTTYASTDEGPWWEKQALVRWEKSLGCFEPAGIAMFVWSCMLLAPVCLGVPYLLLIIVQLSLHAAGVDMAAMQRAKGLVGHDSDTDEDDGGEDDDGAAGAKKDAKDKPDKDIAKPDKGKPDKSKPDKGKAEGKMTRKQMQDAEAMGVVNSKNLTSNQKLKMAIKDHVTVNEPAYLNGHKYMPLDGTLRRWISQMLAMNYIDRLLRKRKFCWDVASMAHLFQQYKSQYSWWRVENLFMRLLYAAVVFGLEPSGPTAQLLGALCVTAAQLLLAFRCRPFVVMMDFWLDVLLQLALITNVLSGVFVEMQIFSPNNVLLNLIVFWTNISAVIFCGLLFRPELLLQAVRRAQDSWGDRMVTRSLFAFVKKDDIASLELWDKMLPAHESAAYDRDESLIISRSIENRARLRHLSVIDASSPFEQNLMHAAVMANLPSSFKKLLEIDKRSGFTLLTKYDLQSRTPLMLSIQAQSKLWAELKTDKEIFGTKTGNTKLDAMLKYDPNASTAEEGKYKQILAMISEVARDETMVKAKVQPFGRLVTLDLHGQHALTAYGTDMLVVDTICACARHLVDINFADTMLGDIGCRAIAKMLNGEYGETGSLRRLNISQNGVTPVGKARLANPLLRPECRWRLQYLLCDEWGVDHGISHLDVSRNEPPLRMEDGLLLAAVLLNNRELTSINLAHNELGWGGQDGIKAIAMAVKQNEQLTALDVGFNQVKIDGLRNLCDAVKRGQTVVTFGLAGNRIAKEQNRWVCDLLESNLGRGVLTSLDISSNLLVQLDEGIGKVSIDIDGFQCLMRALRTSRQMNSVDISHNNLGGWDSPHLESLAGYLATNRTLTLLKLDGNQLNFSDIEAVAEGLKKNRNITRLDLADNRIGLKQQSGLLALVKGIEGLPIRYLNLRENCLCGVYKAKGNSFATLGKFDDSGLLDMCDALAKGKTIRTLDVSQNLLHGHGIARVAAMVRECTALRSLSLSKCALSTLRETPSQMAERKGAALGSSTSGGKLGFKEGWKKAKGKMGMLALLKGAEADKKMPRSTSLVEHTAESRDLGALERLCGALRDNNSVLHLDLGGNALGDEGVQMVAEMLHGGRVMHSLELRDNECGVVAAEALLHALNANHTLQVIADSLVLTSLQQASSLHVVQVLAGSFQNALESISLVNHISTIPIKKIRLGLIKELDLSGQALGVSDAVLVAGLAAESRALRKVLLMDNDIAGVLISELSLERKIYIFEEQVLA